MPRTYRVGTLRQSQAIATRTVSLAFSIKPDAGVERGYKPQFISQHVRLCALTRLANPVRDSFHIK